MKNQYMPMFWGDFFANTLHLTAQEVGAYVLLIAHAWEHEGKFRLADAKRIARVNPRHWQEVWARLEPFFELELSASQDTPTRYAHSRVLAELSKSAEISNKRKAAALQMHSKSSANALQTPPHLDYPSNIESLTNGKGRQHAPTEIETVARKQNPTELEPVAARRAREESNEYRSPPKAKPPPLDPLPARLREPETRRPKKQPRH